MDNTVLNHRDMPNTEANTIIFTN